VPFVSKVYLFLKLSLKIENFFSGTSSFAICPYYEKSSLGSFEGGMVGFWEALGLNNMR
jgi:hypothetical protein